MAAILYIILSLAFMAVGTLAGFAAIILSGVTELGLMALETCFSFYVMAIWAMMRADNC